MGLLDSTRTISRVSPACVVCGDLLVLCLAIPSIFLIMLSNSNNDAPDSDPPPDPDPGPWASTDFLSLSVTFAIW